MQTIDNDFELREGDEDEWRSFPKEVNDIFREYYAKVVTLSKEEQKTVEFVDEYLIRLLYHINTI